MRRMFSEKQIEKIIQDSPLSQAVEQLKNGTLPVYEVEDDTDMDTLASEMRVPCVLKYNDTAGWSLYLVLKKSQHNLVTYFVAYDEINIIYSSSITWESGDTWASREDDALNEFIDKSYVDNNKGTKLYKHVVTSRLSEHEAYDIILITASSTQITSHSLLVSAFKTSLKAGFTSLEKTIYDLGSPSPNAYATYLNGVTSTPELTIARTKYYDASSQYTTLEDNVSEL